MEDKTRSAGDGEFEERAGEPSGHASAEPDDLRGRLGELGDRLATLVRARPATSLLVAAAAGFIVGRILRA
jgi:hypothetical protein